MFKVPIVVGLFFKVFYESVPGEMEGGAGRGVREQTRGARGEGGLRRLLR